MTLLIINMILELIKNTDLLGFIDSDMLFNGLKWGMFGVSLYFFGSSWYSLYLEKLKFDRFREDVKNLATDLINIK